jgi:hypothetical protein
MKVTIDGETIEGRVTVHLRWDPPLETIIETLLIQVWPGRDSGISTVIAR